MLDFLYMNGYGIYIWATYGLTVAVFGINLWFIHSEKIKIKKRIIEIHKK